MTGHGGPIDTYSCDAKLPHGHASILLKKIDYVLWPFRIQRLVIITDYKVLKRQSTKHYNLQFRIQGSYLLTNVAFCTEYCNFNTSYYGLYIIKQ